MVEFDLANVERTDRPKAAIDSMIAPVDITLDWKPNVFHIMHGGVPFPLSAAGIKFNREEHGTKQCVIQ